MAHGEWGRGLARRFAVALAGVIVVAAGSARAGGDLRFDAGVDIPVVAVGGLGLLLATHFQGALAQPSCRWCEPNAFDAGMRSALRWDDTAAAQAMSSVGAFGLAPAVAFGLSALAAGHDGGMGGYASDAFVIAESTLLAADLHLATKLLLGRQRPSVRFAAPGGPVTAEDNCSFFSGHTTVAFALAVSAGTVASMHDYRLAPLVWASGLSIAATTGYLRVAGDRHYFTDVATGAVLGSLVGFAVPYFLHGGASQSAVAVGNAAVLGWSGKF
jgi:membrane-associated phospholipid phosphatase